MKYIVGKTWRSPGLLLIELCKGLSGCDPPATRPSVKFMMQLFGDGDPVIKLVLEVWVLGARVQVTRTPTLLARYAASVRITR